MVGHASTCPRKKPVHETEALEMVGFVDWLSASPRAKRVVREIRTCCCKDSVGCPILESLGFDPTNYRRIWLPLDHSNEHWWKKCRPLPYVPPPYAKVGQYQSS